MRRSRLIGIGVLVFIIGLIVLLPARVVSGWLQAPGDPLRLSGVHGTLLAGRAARVSIGTTTLENVHWQWQPAALLTGRLAIDVHVATDLGGLDATFTQTFWGATAANDIHGRASVRWLARHTGRTFVPISGRLTFDMHHVTLNDRFVPSAANGQLQLSRAYWQFAAKPLRLGSYTARITTTDGRVRLRISDSDGPLVVRGHITVSPESNHYTLRARLRTRAGAKQRLQTLLSALGPADAQGVHHINAQGRL